MTKALVLAEKPSVAREIGRVLGCSSKDHHFLEGSQYVVTWALGHLIELKMPEDYDNKYKNWRMEDLPIVPDKMEIKPIKETRAQLNAIRKLSRRKDLDRLIIATDAGREGELVARWIIEDIRWRKPVMRLWISSQTDRAIRDGFKSLKPARDFDKLYRSAVCRSEADWLIGLNVSRALTTKYNDSLSAGRVQTPTLALILKREEAIRSFRPEPYWTISADIGPYEAVWQHGKTTRLPSGEIAEAVVHKLKGCQARVVSVERKQKKEPQPLPYDLTELQRVANRQLGFSARKTLNTLQNLYERYKIVTYPRTDSRYLTRDIAATMPERLKAISSAYGSEVRQIMSRQKGNVQAHHVYNDAKVTDHHGLIPTEEPVYIGDLSADERSLYDLIVIRFLALFYPTHKYETVRALIDAGGETLVIRETVDIDPGFKALTKTNETKREAGVGELKPGRQLTVQRAELHRKLTEPPARYSEADILTQMEKYGLGTPATRADIIEKLLQSETVERDAGGRLCPTAKGKQLIELVNPTLKSPELTSKWERRLEAIARGEGKPEAFLADIRRQTVQLVREVRESTKTYKIHNLTGVTCPECGSPMKETKDRDGARTLVCINRSCGFRKRRDPKLSNRRCPHCHKKMEIHRGKAGVYFQCRSCGIVEKAERSKKHADKREARKIMAKINNDGDAFGNSLADALKSALKNKDGK